ncbi:MAG: hypothetical protein GY804_09805 [Alphaproteobacteria bacterium]|nr:hypothetical protein [Alphaproteobacteria bacterium]
MATNDWTDKGYVSKYGGGVLKVAEVLDTGLPVNNITITGISQANPGVVSCSDTGTLQNGDIVIIEGVSGMTEVNDILFTVAGLVADTSFTIGVNTTGYGAWSSGGTAKEFNVTTFGYIQETNLGYKKPKEELKDETGATVTTEAGDVETGISGVLMQSNLTLLDFLRDETENKYYLVYYKMSPTGDLNGLTQEIFVGIGVFTPGFELVSGTRRPPFEITFLKNDSAITIGEPDVIFGSIATSDIVIAAEKYYEIVEN